jgi:hypothetical protein
MVLLQGGSVDHNSFVPYPITLSSVKTEVNAATVAVMIRARTRMIFMEVLYGNPDRPYTIPVFSNSAAAIAISKNEKGTHCTRRIACRYLDCRQANIAGDVAMHHISGDAHQLADLGTKNVPASESAYKLSIVEVPLAGTQPIVRVPVAQSKRGDGAEPKVSGSNNAKR